MNNSSQPPKTITVQLSLFLQILIRHREWACPGPEILNLIKEADPEEQYCHIEFPGEGQGQVPKVWYIHSWKLSWERQCVLKEQQKQDNIKADETKRKREKLRNLLRKQCANEARLESLVGELLKNPIIAKALYNIDINKI